MARPASYDRDTALGAAMTLFWRQGFHATSLKDIEAALGMNPGSIYAAFGNKERLYLAAMDRYVANAFSDPSEGPTQTGPLDQIKRFLTGLAQSLMGAPRPRACMLVKTMLELSQDEGPLRAAAMEHIQARHADIRERIVAAQAAGELRPDVDAEILAAKIQTFVFGLRVQAELKDDPDLILSLTQDMIAELDRLRPV